MKAAFDIKKGDLVVCTSDGKDIINAFGEPINHGITRGNVYKVINIDWEILTIRNDDNEIARHSALKFIKINEKVKI